MLWELSFLYRESRNLKIIKHSLPYFSMKNKFQLILLRYLIIVLFGLSNLWLIYLIASPLTIYASLFTFNLIGNAQLTGNTIQFADFSIILTNACIAGAAYYLLLLLNLTTPMPLKTRLKVLAFSIIAFFILNIIRIITFAYLYSSSFSLAETAHKLTWYLGSTFFVVLIWFSSVKLFKIKEIPVYSDIKRILESISIT